MYYFKNDNGIGTTKNKENVKDVTWITREEFIKLSIELEEVADEDNKL